MSKIDHLKAEIERLSAHELAELVEWLSEKYWEQWDSQIEAGSASGQLDFLVEEARRDKAENKLNDL